ncbi:phage major capsid protein [Limosilactobacillus reuteri]|uniref:Phage major capsid protein n=1 Tax=Limosilactobacillus reuteri TaxID=1598 RepID=A0AAX2SSZ0_LIMRT|nr:phage major capsid protein [Limosilactobacillus reuteri]MBV0920972.1 phage major capsid protein [Limosilactobacillus reuteri]RMX27218.1 phage major capsid protein [Limosilactobacillus reuteri]TGB12505.1 phage major capsid protein [Limosilactobacillus reuteri]
MNINQLNDAWIAKGQAVSDLNAELNAAVLDDNFAKDKFAELKAKRDNLSAQRDAIKGQLDEARAAEALRMSNDNKKPLNKEQNNLKNKFVNDVKAMLHGRFDAISSDATIDDNGNGGFGLTIPQDIQTAIHALIRSFATLQNYVNVEHVATNRGSRVYENENDIKPMVKMDEGAAIPGADVAKLHIIKYLISDYGALYTLTNDLLNDTAENLLSYLTTQIAKKDALTRNLAIIDVMNKAPKKPTITKFDDIKDLSNNTLDPLIENTSIFLTNQSGYNVLSKVKDAEGRYLIQPDPTQPDRYLLDGKLVVRVADKWLQDINGSHPLYFGDFKQAITLFDRQDMQILATNIGGGAYETNTYKVRVIDRFDVQATDTGAMAVGSFKTVANQQATTPEDSGKTA